MGWKAFHKGMICRDKKYAENTVFEESGAENCCEAGVMHYCEHPFDVLNYYPLVDESGELSEFAKVEPIGEVIKDGDKCACAKIKIGEKVAFDDYVDACVNDMIGMTKTGIDDLTCSSGNGAQIGSSGDWAKIGSSGDGAKIKSTGTNSIISAIGANSRVSGRIGSWIVLAEYSENGSPISVQCAKIDGEVLNEDVFYTLRNGEIVECNDERNDQ